MRFFDRNKEAVDTGRSADVPFEVRRSPRNSRMRTTSRADPSGSVQFDAAARLDPAETTRTRARRRLIGAVALALAAIVFVPMLFDRTPVAPADDIALQIPDRDTPFEGRKGVPDPARGPLKPTSDLYASTSAPTTATAPMTEARSPDAGAENADKPTVNEAPPTSAPAAKAERPVVAKTPERPAEKPLEKAADKLADKPADKSADRARPAATTDDPRAIAALEGKPLAAAATTSTAPSSSPPSASSSTVTSSSDASSSRTYAVQIAAYAAPEKARSMRDQLVANGLKSYVESVSTAQGLRTRVRLGPFATRDAAEHARTKLKTMKLDGSVVPL